MLDSIATARPSVSSSKVYHTYVLVMLMLVYASNFADRNIIAVVQEQIKHEFHLADWQLGFLGGTAFAVLYSVVGVPIARLADYSNRVNIISVCMAIWSGMTAFCGFANSLVMLVAGRIGVGIGEAGATPPSHSLISNYFSSARRAWALSVYSAGMPVGAMTAALAGGWIAQNFGWRHVFWVLGVVGIALAIIVRLTIAEPPRPASADAQARLSLAATLRRLFSRRTYRHVLVASIIGAFVNAGIVQFTISFFIRSYDLKLVQATLIFGVAQGIFATGGVLGGGAIVNHFRARLPKIESWVCTFSTGICGGAFIVAFLVHSLWIAIGALMIATLMQWLYVGPSFGMMQAVAHERGRATAMAVYLFCTSLLGGGLGPLAVGTASDIFARLLMHSHGLTAQMCSLSNATRPDGCLLARATGLQSAIVIFCVLFLWASYHFWRAGDHLVREAAD